MKWINFFNKMSLNEPSRNAIVDHITGKSWSYRELRLEVDRWASFLQKNGLKKGDRLALLEENRLEHISLFFACAQLGAIFVPLNWRLGHSELQDIIDRVEPSFFIGLGEKIYKTDAQFIDLNTWHLPANYKYTPYEGDKNDPLLMLFTSGTTGDPKGVLFHGAMLEANQWATVKEWGLKKDDISIVETPFFHTGGYNVLLLPLLLIGGSVVLTKGFDPDKTLQIIEEKQVSAYFGVPTMFQRMSESKSFENANLSSVRFLISGGAPCSKELIQIYSQKKKLNFRQGFGMTEVGPNCFCLPEKDAIRKLGSVGKPMKHTRTMVIKEDGDFAKVGEVGELWLGGPHVCTGYFKEEDRYKKSFERGFFKSGDLVQFDEEGYFFIIGRKKEMFISGGENVYPAEVEKYLSKHPSIEEAVVVPVSSEKWGEVGFAFYRGKDEVSFETLRRFLNPMLSRYKHPGHIQRIEEFPLLATGKINKQELIKLAQGQV